MPLFDAVDIYCERTGFGLWGEPLNAITNLAFFIAAWLLYRLYSSPLREGIKEDPEALALIGLVALVGLGSLLFHLFANELAQWADVIPIALFVFYYLWVALRRLVGISSAQTMAALLGFFALCVLASYAPPPYRFNGSVSYFPCWLAIVAVGWVLSRRRHPASEFFTLAALWFTVSLIFRSMDLSVCQSMAIGTHFLWHVCNGVVLYLLVGAILNRPANAAN